MKKTILYLFLLFSTTLFSQFQTSYPPLKVCDDNNDGYATFDLTSKIPEILAGVNPADYEVYFHETVTDATTGTNPFANSTNYTNIVAYSQTIYISIVNINTNQVSVASMSLIVNAKPILQLSPLTSCFIQGLASFDLGSVAEQVWAQNGSNSNIINISFHYTQTDALNQANPLPYYFTTQNSVTDLFVNVINTETGCSSIGVLVLIAEDCGGAPCSLPLGLTVNAITTSSAIATWTSNSSSTDFEYIVLPQGAPAPTANTLGAIPTFLYQTSITGLSPNTCYTVYVRTVCSTTESSAWSAGVSFCSQPTGGSCGETFTDNGGANGDYLANSDTTTVFCPSTPGDLVTVTFASFNTEATWDGLYVFDGNSINSPQIASTNGVGNSLLGALAGAFWGTTIPGPFTSSSPDGCLTFHFLSDASVVRAGWVANITCAPPATCFPITQVATSMVTTNSATVAWTDPNAATSYEVLLLPQGSPAPTAATTGFIVATTNPFIVTGLTSDTCYTVYVRARCATDDASLWSTGSNFCTQVAPAGCGGTFVDNGGATGNYLINSNITTTICPSTSGAVVTVTFNAFNTEAGWDGLYVFNGNSPFADLIPSTNAAGNNPALNVPGAFWGTTIPGPFTSTSPDGCLTFKFLSDNSVVGTGWVANVTCAPPATCLPISQVTSSAVTSTSATVSWTNPNVTTNFEVLLLPQGSPTPTAETTGFVYTTTNPFALTGLSPNTCYAVYVRARCDANDASVWSSVSTFCTQVAPPVCGGTFVDNGGATANYANNSNVTTTICPTTLGQSVTVTFTEFNTEANWDGLYVYDGNSINSPQIASGNGTGNGTLTTPGAYWGTQIPGPFTSTNPDGCLTFVFRSDASFNNPGWVANVTCESVDRVILHAFMDTNNNGIKDTGEVSFNHGSFVYDTNNSGTNTEGYSPQGLYILSDDSGTNSYDIGYQIQPEYAPYFSAGTTAYTDITIPVLSGTQNLYFPITVTQTFTDVAVTIIPINAPRAGITNYRNQVIVSNLSSETIATTTLTFTKDSNLTIVNVSDAGATNTPTGFTRIFTNLLPNESRSISVNMSVPNIPTVNIGQVLTNVASVTPPSNDLLANNNSTSLSQPIVAAYDPNDKMESHGDRIQYDSFTQNDYLFYTIRFENTGSINAIDVKVTDVLSNEIDETSVRMISASHDYVLTRTGSNLSWEFKDIQLSVSIPNTQLGKGFITFKVKLKPGFAIGDIIPNTASIFFDTNPAIVTNTFNTEFVQLLSNTTFTDGNVVVYPNPASAMVHVALNNSAETIRSIVVYDLLGKTVIDMKTITSNQVSINTSSLTKGVYLLEINSNTNVKLIKKLVIQ